MHVLVIDDERSARRNLRALLESFPSVTFAEAANLAEARAALERGPFDLCLVDIRLSEDARNRDGLTLVREIAERTSAVPVCVTASSDMELIRTAMRAGAYDYLLKDGLCEETLGQLLGCVAERQRLEREVTALRARVRAEMPVAGLVGGSAAMERLRGKIRRAAVADAPVLVLGPNGTGKELVVRALHQLGPRPEAPLVELNCGAIAPELVESQLFGHVRGSFTSAAKDRDGVLAATGDGTLFLDEIGDLARDLQKRLLRVLETRDYTPVGVDIPRRFTGRVVAATNADLPAMVARGDFREDLYYRLAVVTLRVPPLSERLDDIPALVAHFCQRQRRPLRFTADAIEMLQRQAWPGNVRELRNLVDTVAVFAEGDEVNAAALRDATERQDEGVDALVRRHVRALLTLPIPACRYDVVTGALVDEALAMNDHNKSAAARLLDKHRKFVERRTDTSRPSAPPDDDD